MDNGHTKTVTDSATISYTPHINSYQLILL